MIDLNYRWEMLESSLTARVREITEYQVNMMVTFIIDD